ncbi:MAG: YigZ family protein [Planctomycetota bacterium]
MSVAPHKGRCREGGAARMMAAPPPTDKNGTQVQDSERPDHYEAVDEGPEVETKVKASRFLARVFPVRSREEAEAALTAVRRLHHDARHHCWAWRLGPPESATELANDDGEPGGSAGPPILGALRRAEVLDALCVVTRWFGGTKLGTGGLVRAYGEAAALALEATPRRTVARRASFSLACRYDDLGLVEAVLARHADRVHAADRDFGATPRFRISTLASESAALRAALAEATAGRARIEDLGEELDR